MNCPQTLVVKIGTSSLSDIKTNKLALSTIASLVETLTYLRRLGHRVILVSSGAVGIGCQRLKISERPQKMSKKQAVAAVGQGRLIRIYDDLFTNLEQPIAQILLTRQEIINRSSYVNIHNTLTELLNLEVIPIVNENDTVAIDELKIGDNDTLSALVASLIEANWLFLLTDVDRLYSADPRLFPTAKPIVLVNPEDFSQLEIETSTKGSQWGTGGMATKITAARIATNAGVKTVITQGKEPSNIIKIIQGEIIGTQFEAAKQTDKARKRWIANVLIPQGKVYLDAGAIKAICQKGKSLLAVGILKVEGDFNANDAVELCNEMGLEIARGIVNYSSSEINQIKGQHSQDIVQLLGYLGAETIVHRDNLVIKE